jgi:23S rRNA pseudouridine2605 synthase
MKPERVQKIISNAGFCSRRAAEDFIAQGKVSVNGKTIKLGDKATINDEICIGRQVLEFDRKRYIKFNKPRDVLTTLYDPYKKDTIMRYMQDIPERIFPIGRLDYDAEGLILFTNDGDFANRVMHPRYETVKVYEAKTRDRIDRKFVESLKGIMRLKDGNVKIEHARWIDSDTVEIAIHEGRNKIVKRIFKELGFYVRKLRRIQIGGIKLGNLKPGRWIDLTEEEIRSVIAGKEPAHRKV